MKRKSNAQVYRAYHDRMKVLLKGYTEKEIFDALSNGKNTYLRLDRMQSSSFDNSWIDVIEGCIFDLGDIVNNPRMTTKQVANLVPIELARKTNAKSVQHLASHTQYIKEIDDYGNVIPSKIMTISNEDDIHTYENRFIATLVRRLVLFIEKRYEIVAKNAELQNEEILMIKNESNVGGATVEIETKIKVSYKNDDPVTLTSNAYVDRILKIREFVQYFYKSAFMHKFKTEKNVRNPIQQTNIIRKNQKYRHCYEVYRFIETYDRLGVNYKVSENFSNFTDKEIIELNRTIFANYVTLKGKNVSKDSKAEERIYKPKIVKSLDDEKFIYGPLLSTPITLVRVDESYKEYLDSKINKDLPLYPTKDEKEYYASEYEVKKEIKEEQNQIENLLKRKNREVKGFEKSVNNVLKNREKAKQALEEQKEAIIKREEEDRLSVAREAIVISSLEVLEEKENRKPAPKGEPIEKKYREPEIQVKERPEAIKVLPGKRIKKPTPLVENVILPEEKPNPVEKKTIVIRAKIKSAPKNIKSLKQSPEKKDKTIKANNKNKIAKTKKTASEKIVKKDDNSEKTVEKFIVKTNKGYYVDRDTFSINKDDAKIMDERSSAEEIKKIHGGRIFKL